MKEIWKDVAGYEGLYQVSDKGRVRSVDHITNGHKYNGKIIKQRPDKDGYMIVSLSGRGRDKFKKVHRLVAIAFIPNPYNKPVVNHKNELKNCNESWNLEWMTVKENNNYGNRNLKLSLSQRGKPRDYMKGEKNYFYGKHIGGADHPQAKKVYQYNLNGKYITEYGSVQDAGKLTSTHPSAISMCCRQKRKKANNFIWSYEKLPQLS